MLERTEKGFRGDFLLAVRIDGRSQSQDGQIETPPEVGQVTPENDFGVDGSGIDNELAAV